MPQKQLIPQNKILLSIIMAETIQYYVLMKDQQKKIVDIGFSNLSVHRQVGYLSFFSGQKPRDASLFKSRSQKLSHLHYHEPRRRLSARTVHRVRPWREARAFGTGGEGRLNS